MERQYCIRNSCIIRDRKIIRNGKTVFSGNEEETGSFLSEAYKFLGINYPKFYKMDNLCKLGFLASEILLQDIENGNTCNGAETGIILYNAASSADTDRNHQVSIADRSAYFPSPSVFVYTLANIVIGEICIRNKFYGENTFFICKEFDPDAVCEYVSRLMDDQIVQCCITGWVELEGDHYDCVLYLVEKTPSDPNGIVIFETGKISEIYSQ